MIITNKIKYNLLPILLILGILLFLTLMAGSQKKPACGKALEFHKNEIEALVIDKYIDYENHANLVLKLEGRIKRSELRFVKGNRESIIYEKAVIGDIILKNPKSSFVIIKDSNEIKFSNNVYYYRCDSVSLNEKLKRLN